MLKEDHEKGRLIVGSADWMNKQTPRQRLDFLSTLRVLSNFCWNCGHSFDNPRHECCKELKLALKR